MAISTGVLSRHSSRGCALKRMETMTTYTRKATLAPLGLLLIPVIFSSGCSRSSNYYSFKGVRLDMSMDELKSALEKLKPRDARAFSHISENALTEGADIGLLQEDLHIRTLSQKATTGADAVVEICGSLSEWANTAPAAFEKALIKDYGNPTGKLVNGKTTFLWWGEGRFKPNSLDMDYSGKGKVIMAKCIGQSCKVLLRNHIVRRDGDFVILRSYGRMERYTPNDPEAGNGWVHIIELSGVPLCLSDQ